MSPESTEERKLAAIMFTDMVGYSALSQRSEALALELLEEHRRIVRSILPRHGGREVKTTGDGFLLEFPSALAAVQCAVEIQNAFHKRNQTSPSERQLQLRIGIHVGDVVVREGDIHGDGVNIAARLEPLAPAGGICVSNAIHEQVRNKLEQTFVSLGPAELKNIELPVAVHRVVMPWEEPGAGKLPGSRRHGRANMWKIVFPVCAVALGGVVILWHPWRKSVPAAETAERPAPLSEARQLVAKARQLFEKEDDSNRENLLLADELLLRAETLDPTDGEVWAAHAQLSGVFISLAYDSGNARHAAVRAQAERAMKLAPESVESRLAKAWYLTSQPNTLAEGEAVLADLIKRAPNDWRPLRIMGHTARRLGRFDEGLTWLDRAAAFPEGAAVAQVEKATVLFNEGRIPEAEAAVEESLKVRQLGRALLLKVNGLTLWEGDLEAAKKTLEQMPPSLMLEDRGAFLGFRVWLWRREPAKCLVILNGLSRDFLEDQYFQGPKAFLVAATHKLAGRPDAARPEWEHALRLIEERLRGNPGQMRLLCEKALCLTELDKPVEAEAALRACQQAGKCETQMWPGGGVAGGLLKLGRPEAAMDEIVTQIEHGTLLYNSRAVLELNPDFDPLRSNPRFQQILSRAPGPTRPAGDAIMRDSSCGWRRESEKAEISKFVSFSMPYLF